MTNIPALFVRNPDWHVVFDNDPAMARGDAPQVLRHGGGREDAGAGYHFSFPAVGYVEKDGKGYRLVPVAWQPTI